MTIDRGSGPTGTGTAGVTVAASNVVVTPTGSLVATDGQAAFAELDSDLSAHLNDTSAAHAASAISFTPAGNVAATDVQAAIAELDNEKQPLDATLTALAGLNTGADKLPYSTGVNTFAEADFTAAARTVVDDATVSDMRTTLGLAIGTDVQAYDADLAAIAGLTSANNKIPYFTGSGTAALLDRDTDGTLAANSDTSIPTQKAVKTYADTKVSVSAVNTFTQEQLFTDGAVVSGTISEVAGVGSTAVALELQGSSDSGFSIYRTGTANTTDECYTAHFAKDAGGTVRKVHSLSSKWGSTNATNGYSLVRYNAPYLSGGVQTDDLSIRQFGGLGVVIGGNSDSDVPASDIAGVKFLIRYNTYVAAVLYTSGQVNFPATANPSADANTLDDYEEGSVTVTAACGTSGTITLTSGDNGDVLYYTKIGNMVHVHGFIQVASVSAPVGTLTINGLPFTVGKRTAVTVQADGLAASATTSIVARAAESGTAIRISKYAAGAVAALAGDVQAGSEFYLSLIYRV